MSIPDPILRFRSNDGKIVDILEDWDIADPYWRPQIAQYKGGGTFINSGVAEGKRLVSKEYDNVIETIPLTARGTDQDKCIKTIRELLQLGRQAADYWTEIYEFDNVWLECKPACNDCLTGYARIVKMSIPELSNPFGQPFFTGFSESIMDGLTLTIEREPLWRGVAPGELVGPLYNLLRNPDFELWNFGVGDSQPDSWSDLETIQITGTNNRDDTAPHSGNYDLKVRVSGSTLTGRVKGVTQVVSGIQDNTEYTVVAWVRSEGVSNGVGRILVTYSSQLEVYRSATMHGWTLYTGKFTTGDGDVVAISLEILTTAANTDGTVYFDSLMLLEGDWDQEAIDGILPYISSSHVVNHWDTEAGDINFVDTWEVPGDEDALVRLEIVNNTQATTLTDPVEVIAALRVGMRRGGDVFNFQGFQDPNGPLDTTASDNSRINSGTLSTTEWTTISSFSIQTPTITQDNIGRFRLLARLFDTRTGGVLTLQARLRYWVGAAGVGIKILDAETVQILNNWCIVNLTPNAAVNWDTKGRPDPPSAFGFDIQMKRTANTDQGRLDYALLLPTDGGCLIAAIDPPVLQNQGVVVDNTLEVQTVFGAHIISQWNVVANTPPLPTGAQQEELLDFNNALYIRTFTSGNIYKYQNNSITLPITSPDMTTMAVYNGRIFFFDVDVLSNGYGCDGVNFSPLVSTFTFGAGTQANRVIAFGGYLYIAARSVTSTAVLYRWDGSAATATLILERATIAGFFEMAIADNKIYLAGQEAGTFRVYIYDIATGSFQESLDTGSANAVTNLLAFNGQIWANNQTGTIYSFDGITWSTQTPFAGLLPTYYSMNDIDGVLFTVGTDIAATPDRALVIKSEDNGLTWEIDYHPTDTTIQRGRALAKSQGQLFMATLSDNTIPAKLHAKSLNLNEYKVSDYQLIPFASPPEKRHRFFFNWDRENGVNVTDDAALVGLGFVPRYLALRGHG